MPQLLRADKELFTILAREVETIQPDTVGNRPLDEAITRLKTDPRVTMHLCHYQPKRIQWKPPTLPSLTMPGQSPSRGQGRELVQPMR